MPSHQPSPARTVLPTLPIVTAVAGALLAAGCDSPTPRQQVTTRVCQDADGRRTADENCDRRVAGHGFVYVPGMGGAFGDRVNGGRSNPADVSRGGFGMSAHSSSGE